MVTGRGTKFVGAKVLIVEDYMLNQELVEAMLTSMGIESELAEDGNEAIEKFQADTYDLILMDVMMPDMDGYEATQKIRELDGGKEIPIVAVTANALPEDKEKCINAGMSDYITKPINPDAIEAVLKKYLSDKIKG